LVIDIISIYIKSQYLKNPDLDLMEYQYGTILGQRSAFKTRKELPQKWKRTKAPQWNKKYKGPRGITLNKSKQ
jgi:hypothetical protein